MPKNQKLHTPKSEFRRFGDYPSRLGLWFLIGDILTQVMDGYMKWCTIALKSLIVALIHIAGFLYVCILPLLWMLKKLHIIKAFPIPKGD